MVEFVKNIFSTLGDLLLKLIELPGLLIEKFGELLKSLFVPDENYFSGKIESIRSQVKLIDDLFDAVETYKSSIGNTNGAPTITADFGKYGGEMKVLDLSFYAPYKNYGDLIVNAFLWGCFIWRCFMHLHTTIRGVSDVKTAVDFVKEN